MEEFVKEIISDYNSGMFIYKIAEKYTMDFRKVRKYLVENNIKLRDNNLEVSKARTKLFKLTKNQISILEGFLLGDGCIVNNNTRKYHKAFTISNTSKELVIKIKKMFPINFFSNIYKNKYNCYYIYSKSCNQIKYLYNKWYNPLRIIPNDFKINKINLYWWYISDGMLSKRFKRKDWIKISSVSKHKSSLLNIIKQLKKLGIEAYLKIAQHNMDYNHGFSLYINIDNTPKFLNFIKPNILKDFEYKFNYC